MKKLDPAGESRRRYEKIKRRDATIRALRKEKKEYDEALNIQSKTIEGQVYKNNTLGAKLQATEFEVNRLSKNAKAYIDSREQDLINLRLALECLDLIVVGCELIPKQIKHIITILRRID